MKKALVIAFAALLVLAFSLPVMAQTKVEFSGSYRVRMHNKYNFNLADESNAINAPAFPSIEEQEKNYDQRFRMSVRFMPSDALTLTVDTEANDTKFGGNPNAPVNATFYGTQAGRYAVQQDAGTLELYHTYMTIKTQVGAFSLGRMPGGVAGLALLGYSGGYRGNALVFDGEEPRDRLRWIMPYGPMTFGVIYDALAEYDSNQRTTHDADNSAWSALLQYKFASGAVNIVITRLNLKGLAFGVPGADAQIVDWRFTPAMVLNFGPIGVHAELQYDDGEQDNSAFGPLVPNIDREGLGWYLDVTYNYGPGEAGVHYTYSQGDGNPLDNTNEGINQWGGDYEPYLIATAYSTRSAFDLDEVAGRGMHNYGLWVNHNLTEDMMLSAALGFFTVDEPGTVGGVVGAPAISDDYGMEFDVGLQWQLMSNLRWRVDLGYFWAGDWFKQGVVGAEVGDAWALQNELTLTF